jgi:hypothetical protein
LGKVRKGEDWNLELDSREARGLALAGLLMHEKGTSHSISTTFEFRA